MAELDLEAAAVRRGSPGVERLQLVQAVQSVGGEARVSAQAVLGSRVATVLSLGLEPALGHAV